MSINLSNLKTTKNLKGSKNKDEFRYQHKQIENYKDEGLYEKAYGCNIDFVEIRNNKIIAFLNIKKTGDQLTYIERIAYMHLKSIAPIFILFCNDWSVENIDIQIYYFEHMEFLTEVCTYNSRKLFFSDFISNIEDIVVCYN